MTPDAMADSFVRLLEVTKKLGDRRIVEGVSFEVSEGEILALLGASGSGKTTTLRLIAGLEIPDNGEIWIAGKQVAARGRNCVLPYRRGIGFVFQDLALWPHLTVAGSLEFVLASAKVAKNERSARIAETLRMVRIDSFADRYPDSLSGGEQQRAALARALVGRPRLLLMDEPFSSLDVELKKDLLREFIELQQLQRITTIYVTHDREEAGILTTRVTYMQAGRLELQQSRDREAADNKPNC